MPTDTTDTQVAPPAAGTNASNKSSSTSSSTTIDISNAQLLKSITSLYAYLDHTDRHPASPHTTKSQLITTNPNIYLQLALNAMPTKVSHMPHRLPLKHSLYDADEHNICLIIKDNTKPAVQSAIDAFATVRIDRVLELTELKKQYNTDKGKRELCSMYTVFLMDNRLVRLIKPVIGKHFIARKKQPVPVAMDRSLAALEHNVKQALDATYMFVSKGTTVQIKIGTTAMSRQQVADNILSVLPHLHRYVPTKSCKVVQAVYVKTHDSAAIPVYAQLPGDVVVPVKKERVKRPIDVIDKRIKQVTKVMKRKYDAAAVLPLAERNRTYLQDDEVYEMLVKEFEDDVHVPVKKSKTQKTAKASESVKAETDKIAVKTDVKEVSKKPVKVSKTAGEVAKKTKAINQPKSKDTRKWLQSKTR